MPGSPWENGYCECFNAKLRDELLNGEIFYTLEEAKVDHRGLEAALQYCQAALIARLQTAGPRGSTMAGFATRASFAGHPSRSATAGHALTFNPDHLMGASQCRRVAIHRPSTQDLTTLDRFGLVTWVGKEPMLRMLQVDELRRAIGFPASHAFDHGTRRDKIRLLGNGVAPPVMKAVVEALVCERSAS